jgi:hypothetical protein
MMSQSTPYKFLIKLFKYTRRTGDEETIQFMRFDPAIPSPFIRCVDKEEPGYVVYENTDGTTPVWTG